MGGDYDIFFINKCSCFLNYQNNVNLFSIKLIFDTCQDERGDVTNIL